MNLSISAAPHSKWMKSAVLAGLILCPSAMVMGQTTTNVSFTINQNVPQGDPSGLSSTETLNFSSVPNFSSIVDLTVTLNISGGLNGGYYAYLVNDTGGFAILLNRPGTTAGNSLGYTDSGFNITLATGSPDIHTYQTVSNPGGGVLTGTWGPDGRNVDPATVVNTDPQTALLSSFNGTNPNGQWTLFLANLDYGEQGELVSWGMSITAVPEPSSVGLALLGFCIFLGVRYWARRNA
jgi:subtilisin-like proprotein convertase family protein